ncbi:serine hydrolase [Bradyrhizobium elkanii]|uniref:serine hydrolase n=1 Tax=Bradyrhizobium elkanii TaxID=29448 RepID=UPI0020A0B707|nr:serine hydrolase [Bradyrhizobium elkanii]MCP1969274.1 D-alanyl-D-alanine carboxypeptidase [Bradyrhizobium elkanii]MCS4109219.1 D-alanyl-D-alanine carboxypeptidase [Bradyrhizobium elkanii]
MLRTTLASSRALRVGVLGLVTVTTAILITSDSAEARRHRRHYARHHHSQEARESYSPQFASIIVDGNTGSVLTATSPDGLRHPASLTKIMTLYLLFERLDSGKMKLDTEMPVSEHASEQDPTKLGLRPGSTIKVEDAIKGLVTRSANDAAVVIAEAIGGSEDDFARMMTRKARALGMSRTVYRNASGLPNDEQVTTARDQSTLGRAIQDRFPRYYRYFSTSVFNFRGQSIRNHNHLLGNVEGVDGIKTGYTRASGFNLVTSMRRGNRFLVGVVLGGRSGGSRDAIMRNLLAENVGKAATTRTAAAITERNPADANVEVADADNARAPDTSPVAASEPAAAAAAIQAPRPASKPSLMAAAAAALPPLPAKPEPQAKPEPAPLTSGVIQTHPIAAIPGSAEPMKPVKVKTVQVKAGQIKLAAAGPAQSAPPITNTIPARGEVPETSNAMMARAAETSRPEMPPQPANFGTGNGILGVLPASAVHAPAAPASQAVASIEPATRSVQAAPPTSSARPSAAHTGWIIQVGALESEGEANKRIDLARSSARGLLSKADPFTEVVAKDNRKLYRARFAGLERDQAEAACKTLKRAEISCITVRN